MGFSLVGDLLGVDTPASASIGSGGLIDEGLRAFDDKVLGGDAADAAKDAAAAQMAAGREASALLDPFKVLGQSGLDQAAILTDPNAQFQFLQNNPVLDLMMQNVNNQVGAQARASGIGLGSTQAQKNLMNNAMLAGLPLLSQQQGNVQNLLNMGLQTASGQGNLLTGVGAAEAGGIVGAANAQQQGIGNLMSLLGAGAGFLGGPSTPQVPKLGG